MHFWGDLTRTKYKRVESISKLSQNVVQDRAGDCEYDSNVSTSVNDGCRIDDTHVPHIRLETNYVAKHLPSKVINHYYYYCTCPKEAIRREAMFGRHVYREEKIPVREETSVRKTDIITFIDIFNYLLFFFNNLNRTIALEISDIYNWPQANKTVKWQGRKLSTYA